MLKALLLACGAAATLLAGGARAAPPLLAAPAAPGDAVKPYVRVSAPVVVLRHVRVIDGTGAPAVADRTVILANGKIRSVGAGNMPAPAGALVLDLPGHTVFPGLVGMHDHMYYIARPNMDAHGHSEPPLVVPQMTFRRRGCIWPAASPRCAPAAASSPTPT
jgi:hypothetical protein